MRSVAVVGASLAGLAAARALRDQGFDGRVTLVGDEPHRPYDRPPLSKDFLLGRASAEELALGTEADDALDLDWRLGSPATALLPHERRVRLADGGEVSADSVVLATGARARNLPGFAGRGGVHTLRTLEDARALREELRPGARVVVVGAGFIGSEVASTAKAAGAEVTVVEALPVPLAGPLGPTMGTACAALHADHGVRLICGVPVRELLGQPRVTAVRLADGQELPATAVVVGVGAEPNVGWLAGSGVTVDDGVRTDAAYATNLPGVVAVGDCAASYRASTGRYVRTEHWTDALEAPRTAVRTLLGGGAGPAAGDDGRRRAAVPYFWSEQYGVRIQFAGHRGAEDEVRVEAGDPADRSFLAVYEREGRATAVLGVNRPKEFTRWRRALATTGSDSGPASGSGSGEQAAAVL
ncbi:NAD(P)/FAD-dependent oxidoreductase [Streptomyces oceani]|uniref:Pyridine nucleotide-disulfide oxidoreductase n=1 Tax=Streptomyces oceani TaxID=1075402 RepID=A0A1E7KN27_9ACTN|nr:FAD-dependent oxidoreductase [Streptomyces oceani]OEV05382.1 pyridine nucleotide-disulfide oxidoreductase [Streptomyces oceani]